MYSTCLFCNTSLGRNEAIEYFPVGRRLAYDATKGRLWVVCARCERWNLSPLETRWEAIEEAEKAYRVSRQRVSTDNVGLARLSEGLELVRIGSPLRPELATWRYGDQFGRRRRRGLALGALAGTIWAGPQAATWMRVAGFSAGWLVGAGAAMSVAYSGYVFSRLAYRQRIPRLSVRGHAGELLWLTPSNAGCMALKPAVEWSRDPSWSLSIPYHRRPVLPGALFSIAGVRMSSTPIKESVSLRGDVAVRALADVLPFLNRAGAGKRRVADAVSLLTEAPGAAHLIEMAAVNTEAKKTHVGLKDGESNVGALPARIRLALEMSLHEDDERRAMEGELHELERRWRDAEEISQIADSLTAPLDLDERLARLKDAAGD